MAENNKAHLLKYVLKYNFEVFVLYFKPAITFFCHLGVAETCFEHNIDISFMLIVYSELASKVAYFDTILYTCALNMKLELA